MPSILPGFEYDIFISYRHNDNRSGWVTEFVKNLQEELGAIIKDPVSIYFDSNQHDGLLENHDVDDSLRGKLKSVILIPIISQTYCDTRSFAWKNEFLAFKKIASGDRFGLKVKLASGNVASRILPICIHELDESDKQLIEAELGGVVRGIEFIYKSPGVVRPLKAVEEDSKANLNHTFYRDQINKVARAVKEIVSSVQPVPITNINPLRAPKTRTVLPLIRKRVGWAAILLVILGLGTFSYYYFGGLGRRLWKVPDKSIAVIPFENLSGDPEQDYFSGGIADDILNHLSKISDLKVKSRTSTLQYKNTEKTLREIGKELGVANIIEGSVRRVGNQVRVVVQLIDVETDVHLWSETYNGELKDVLALQSEIAIKIADALEAKLTKVERNHIEKEVSKSITAYDYFLKAREIFNTSDYKRIDMESALLLLNHAIKLDPEYSKAFALKGSAWFNLRYFGVSESTWKDSALYFAAKAIEIDPDSPDGYILQGVVHHYVGRIEQSGEDFAKAYEVAPNDPGVLDSYGRKLLRERNKKGAELVLKSIESQYSFRNSEYYLSWKNIYALIGDVATQEKLLQQAKNLNPRSGIPYVHLSQLYWFTGQYAKGIAEAHQAEKLIPGDQFIIGLLGWQYYLTGDFEKAITYWSRYKEIEATFEDSTQTVPFRHCLAMAYLAMGRKKEANELFAEDLMINKGLLARQRSMGSWMNYGSIFYDLAVNNAALGNLNEAVKCLDSSIYYQFRFPWGFRNDPLLSALRNREDFKKVLKKCIDYEDFLEMAYSDAINRKETNHELKNLLK